MKIKETQEESGLFIKMFLYLGMIIAAVFFLLPIMTVVNYSFKTKKELYLGNPPSLPRTFNLDNYAAAFRKLDLSTTFVNTVVYTAISVFILALICGSAAWAIARRRKAFFKISYIYFLIGILIPYQALFISIYIIGFNLHLTNTHAGIILMYIATSISFGIFLLTSFMSTVPVELEECARMDGCSILRTYFSIVLPLLKPAMAALVIMQSFQIWNDYLMASLFISRKDLRTLTVSMQALFSQQSSDYTSAMAAIVISSLPITVLFISLQKYFIKGMTIGAVKGLQI